MRQTSAVKGTVKWKKDSLVYSIDYWNWEQFGMDIQLPEVPIIVFGYKI